MHLRPTAIWLAAALLPTMAEAIEVQRSVELPAAPAEVWSVIGSVCSIADWHPVIESCLEEEDERTLYRVLQTVDGGVLREQMLEISDDDRFYTYSILEGPLPIRGYLATLSVGPGEDPERSVVIWQSDFASVGVGDDEAAGIITGIYDAGLSALAERFAE
jgi:hypothetical protein